MRKALVFYDSKGQLFEFKGILKTFITEPASTLDLFIVIDIIAENLKTNILKNTSYLINAFDEKNSELFSDLYVVEQLSLLRRKLDDVILKID